MINAVAQAFEKIRLIQSENPKKINNHGQQIHKNSTITNGQSQKCWCWRLSGSKKSSRRGQEVPKNVNHQAQTNVFRSLGFKACAGLAPSISTKMPDSNTTRNWQRPLGIPIPSGQRRAPGAPPLKKGPPKKWHVDLQLGERMIGG